MENDRVEGQFVEVSFVYFKLEVKKALVSIVIFVVSILERREEVIDS
mgnify:CR=1 FL=1